MTEQYRIGKAKYAKGKMQIQCMSDGTGMKTRAMRLAEAKGIGGRWTNRSKSYIVSPTAAAKFEKMFAEGCDANSFTREIEAPGV